MPRRQKIHASLPPTPSAPAFFLHAHPPPRAVFIPVCLRPSPGNLFITLSFSFGQSNIPSPSRTIPLLHEVRFFVGGGDSSSTGTTAQRLRGLWSVSGTGEPLLFQDLAKPTLYIYFLFAFPSARPLPTPSSSPTDITEVLSLLRVQRRFFSGHDHPGFSNRDGTSFEERRANSWSFLPFLYPLSLPPRLTRPTLASHTNNIHADGTVTATSSFGPAF